METRKLLVKFLVLIALLYGMNYGVARGEDEPDPFNDLTDEEDAKEPKEDPAAKRSARRSAILKVAFDDLEKQMEEKVIELAKAEREVEDLQTEVVRLTTLLTASQVRVAELESAPSAPVEITQISVPAPVEVASAPPVEVPVVVADDEEVIREPVDLTWLKVLLDRNAAILVEAP